MTSYDFKILGEWLVKHDLATKSISAYTREEVKSMVEFVAVVFGGPQPVPIMVDRANRLIVPANADKDQLKLAMCLIKRMIEDGPVEAMVAADIENVFEGVNRDVSQV